MRIFGTICEAGSGRALDNLIVRAYDRDLLSDKLLGFATTNAAGEFEIWAHEYEAPVGERNFGVFVRVLDGTGEHEIYDTLGSLPRTADAPQLRSGSESEFEIEVPPENLGPNFHRVDRSADTPAEFFQALAALTPRIFVTPALVLLNVAIFAAFVLNGASPVSPAVGALVDWGANIGIRTLSGEWWRLATCLFLHGGILHLALNCYVLFDAGRVVERLVGAPSFATLYLASGLIASLTSLAWNPFAASVGASGAIFGIWGALLGYALCQRNTETLRGLRRLRNLAIVFVLANVLFGMTQEHVDLAAHLGGLIAGIGCGAVLSQPVSFKARAKRGRRLAILCGISAVLVMGFATAIPRRVIQIQAELVEFDRVRTELGQRFNEALHGDEQHLSVSEMRVLLEEDLLPAWNQARKRLEQLRDLPAPLQEKIEAAAQSAREQEAEWRRLAGEFGRFQEALNELQQLEDHATTGYQRAFGQAQSGALSNDDFVDVLYRDVLAEWDFERKLESLDDLREPLRTLAGSLRDYADTRENAWRLYIEAVRTHNEDLSREASEAHSRADAMIADWAAIPIDEPPSDAEAVPELKPGSKPELKPESEPARRQ